MVLQQRQAEFSIAQLEREVAQREGRLQVPPMQSWLGTLSSCLQLAACCLHICHGIRWGR